MHWDYRQLNQKDAHMNIKKQANVSQGANQNDIAAIEIMTVPPITSEVPLAFTSYSMGIDIDVSFGS